MIHTEPVPNIVRDMVEEARKADQRRAQELMDRRQSLAEESQRWNQISALFEHPGWDELVRMMNAEVAKLRDELEKPVDERITAYLRAGIKDLRWLSQLPSLAANVLTAIEQQGEAQQSLEENFIEGGR